MINYKKYVEVLKENEFYNPKLTIMIITTTPTVEWKHITKYQGIVFWEVISWVNIVKDLFAWIRDIVWWRSNSYETELVEARNAALQELAQRATEKWANAVIGVSMNYEVLWQKNSMLMVTACWTAVTVS